MTRDEIDAAATPSGGWTRATLAGWGVSWPPPKGWRKALLAQGTSGFAQDAQRLDPQGAGPVVEDHAPEPSTQTHTTKKKGE